MFWEIVSGPGQQPAAEAASLTAAANSVKAATPGAKTVTFGGYAVSVPASWPVYDLTKDPRQCVRYDKHAVYLGTPGSDQYCPSSLVGRVDTISIGKDLVAVGVLPARRAGPGGRPTGNRKAPAQAGQQAPAPGTIVQYPDLHELALVMPAASPQIGATYGTAPGSTKQILATVRPVGVKASAQSKDTNQASLVVTTPPAAVPSGGMPFAPPSAAGAILAGFDTCTAPSLSTMKKWRAKYAATAIYIGGQMVGCAQRNLSASWVKQAKAMGWALMPTFVGLQAPCDTFSGKINPKRAASQGTAAANQAVADAQSYGLGKGSPIYDDMEAYPRTKVGCRTAVLTFLDAWTRRLEAVGYVPGVYSSANAAIKDLQTTRTIAGHPLAEPKAVWIALWDNAADLDGTPYVTSAVWPVASRVKQYQGNKVVKVGGISLVIDADMVASAVAAR